MKSTRLSAIDAFFVAYQESSGVLMQLGVEVELKGGITREHVEQMLAHVVRRWPPLGQRLWRDWFGLSWEGGPRIREMLRVAKDRKGLAEWRNRPLNPFREPPFQLLWIANADANLFAFRAHHAVVDGEGFFFVCAEALRILANLLGVRRPGAALINTKAAPARRTPMRTDIIEALKNLQRLRDEAHLNKSARLTVSSCTPGDISVVKRDLNQDQLGALQQQATELNVAPAWFCASAWMKAIHEWNRSRGETTSLISLEVPVSLRRRENNSLQIGNLISPLTVSGDASLPLKDLAIELKQQMNRALRDKVHLALPTLSAPWNLLPWEVFRRIAASPELTGFATSHFAWLEQSQTIHDDVLRASGGALEMVDQQIYTPVCLHMGAALAVLAWRERAQIFLTHRLTALSTSEATSLLELVVQELGQAYLKRQQIAV